MDAPLFFGRDTETEIVMANLIASRLTVLYGASGVGKSSILQAGVAHHLRHGPTAGPDLLVIFNQWSGDPVMGLAQQVRAAAMRALGDQADEWDADDTSLVLADTLSNWSTRLGVGTFIILDQFEEYFPYHEHEDGVGTFAVEFPRAVNRLDIPVNFLISIREDALALLDLFAGRLPALFENLLRIQHLSAEDAREAIIGPLTVHNEHVARHARMTVEPELIRAVLDQVRVGKVVVGEAGRGESRIESNSSRDLPVEAPYLQLVMTTLWAEELNRDSRALRASTLHDLGGAQRIVRTHLDQAMEALSRREQDVAAAVFRYLVTPSGSKISHSEQDLADYAELPAIQIGPVLEKLARGDIRILRPVAGPRGGTIARRYEIFHDVLAPAILHWRSRYLQQQAADAELARRLELEAAERRAVEEQARAYRRKARARGALALGMVFVLLIVVTAAILAVQQAKAARKGRIAAQASALTARATAELVNDPAASVHLAADAIRLKPSTPGAELVLRQALGESRLRAIMRGHADAVTSAVFSHKGSYVLTASNDGTARVWAAGTGTPLAVLKIDGPSNSLSPPQFAAGDNTVLISTVRGRAYVWRWRAGAPATVLPAVDISAAALAPKSGLIATGHRDGAIRLWNSSGQELKLESGRRAFVNSLAFSPDERILLSGSDSGLELWRWDVNKRRTVLPDVGVRSVVFSPDARHVVVATQDGSAHVWNLPFSSSAPFSPDVHGVESVSFGPNSDHFITVTGRTAQIWDARAKRKVSDLTGHTDSILQAVFSRDGTQVITASADASARVWEVQNGGELLQLQGHVGAVSGADFSPDSTQAVTGGADHTVRLWNMTAGRVLRAHGAVVNAAEFNPAATRVVTASADAHALSFPVAESDRPTYTLLRSPEVMNSARFSRDGQDVVIAHGTSASVLALAGGRPAQLQQQRYQVTSAAFSSDGQLVALGAGPTPMIWDWQRRIRPDMWRWSGVPTSPVLSNDAILDVDFGPGEYSQFVLTAHADGTVRLWDLKRRTLARLLSDPGADITYKARFGADGNVIVTANGDGRVRIWDTATGRLVQRLQGISHSALFAAALDQHGRLAAGGAADGTVLVWEVASGKLLALIHAHAGPVNSVEFSPRGGNLLLTAGDDGTARLYRCNTCGPVAELLTMAQHTPQ
jgi:WD40 repeat protein